MFDHVTIRVTDSSASERFYDTVLAKLGVERTLRRDGSRAGRSLRWPAPTTRICPPGGSISASGRPPAGWCSPSYAERRPRAPTWRSPPTTTANVRRFHEAAVAAGYESNGSRGERPQYYPRHFAAFVLDPDGNNVEVVNHHR
jgi:catechol 2,3-dioxygenase-like lactoylglutathione lyase family enzyme